jgi:type III secretory pathway component EscV
LITLNLLLVVMVFLITIETRKITDFSLFPMCLLILGIFNSVVHIFCAQLILTNEEAFNKKMS